VADLPEPNPDIGVQADSPWGSLLAVGDTDADNLPLPGPPSSERQPWPAALGSHPGELELQNEALRYSQRIAEGALERFSALFSHVPLALLVIDESGLILESNTMALASLRPLETDAPLTYLLPLVMPTDQARVKAGLAEAKKEGGFLLPHVLLHSGETATLTADLHLARLDNPQDDMANFICALVDQGPALRQMAQKEALESQLRESQKMQAIGTLAGGIAHDFNNILGAILGNAQLARQETGQVFQNCESSQSSVQTSLIEIEKAALRARDLVRQILAFSRKEPLTRSPIALESVVQEAVRLLRLGLPSHLQIDFEEMGPGVLMPLVLADATAVQQALLNMGQNAVQAMQSRVEPLAPGVIRLALDLDAQQHPPQLVLTVADNGPGMDETTQERVFDPFFTTKPVGQGTGLGLSVVHGIMRAHEGSVQVQSKPGEGCVFTLRFNAAIDATTQASNPLQAAPTLGPGQRLMYVDDDPALVFLVQRAFSRQGVSVIAFTDPHLALQALGDPSCAVDLLVTDYNMPGFNGMDVLRDAQRLRPALRVALASGYVTPEMEEAARLAGAAGVIFKPSGIDELSAAISRLMPLPGVV
jgi:signal transduction histidine kinase/ActR/RegA family two-component response regulator